MKRMLIKINHFIIVKHFYYYVFENSLKASLRLWKYITGFIQGTSNDFLSIHLFLGQASVSRLGITLVIKTPVH